VAGYKGKAFALPAKDDKIDCGSPDIAILFGKG
jgi:hypothetical protein